jgi:hypothetical protein
MAERRMFAKTIIGSDAFLDMPQSTQALYFHLAMRADDDGFVNSPKSIMRLVGCKDDDLKVLCGKKFIIPFENGVVVIKHWRVHNYIAKDRYTETKYKNEKARLAIDENGSYTECIQLVDGCETQVRLGKVRLGKDSEEETAGKPPSRIFKKPTTEEIQAYCLERKNSVDPSRFFDYYESKGWLVGRTKMKDWKASVRTWERNDLNSTPQEDPGRAERMAREAQERREKKIVSMVNAGYTRQEAEARYGH